jgi:hypothetical protein
MPSPPSFLTLHAELSAIIRDAAAPLLPGVRSRFYEAVDRELGNAPDLGPGVVARACAKIQRQFVTAEAAPPVVDGRR